MFFCHSRVPDGPRGSDEADESPFDISADDDEGFGNDDGDGFGSDDNWGSDADDTSGKEEKDTFDDWGDDWDWGSSKKQYWYFVAN